MTSPYATIIDNKDFNAPMMAEKIDRALRAGEKDIVVKIITSLSNNQRQQLREPYRIKYGKDIIGALDKKFSGDLEKTIFALMDTPLDYDLKQLKHAMKGLGTDEAVLIEILCSRTPDQIRAIRAGYEKEYGKQLEKEVASETSGEFKDLLVSLITGSKDTSHDTNDQAAKDDAVRLFADGKGKFASKDGPSHFLKILATQNHYQLRKVFAVFEDLSGSTIEKAIEKEFSGDLQKSYLTIARAASDKQKFFAIQLFNSMKGLGTRDNDLIRVLVSRSEVDLELIKEEFVAMYNKSLEDTVRGDTSGLYRDALLAIVVGNKA
uniref:Annexin n=1 Tax=Heterorhabditis bacteriophora TaxID=37862 RepID=A0A1I7WXG3_HETBA